MISQDIYWLAGFIDGDGSIDIAKHSSRWYPRIQIYQSGEQGKLLLEWIHTQIGSGGVYLDRSKNNYRRLPAYKFLVEGNAATQLLKQLLPSLKLKQAKCLWVLQNAQ